MAERNIELEKSIQNKLKMLSESKKVKTMERLELEDTNNPTPTMERLELEDTNNLPPTMEHLELEDTNNPPPEDTKIVNPIKTMEHLEQEVTNNPPPLMGIKIDQVTINAVPSRPIIVPVIPISYPTGADIYKFVDVGKMYVFKVMNVTSPSEFCMEYLRERSPNVFSESSPDKPRLWKDLQIFYRCRELRDEYKLKTEVIRYRMYVVAVIEDGEEGCPPVWKRCILLHKEINARRVNVVLIDEGRDVWVKVDQLYELATIFTDPPAAGFRCHLANIRPSEGPAADGSAMLWSTNVCKQFEKMVKGKRVQAYLETKTFEPFQNTPYQQCKIGVTLYVLDNKPKPTFGLPLDTQSINAQMIQRRYAFPPVGK